MTSELPLAKVPYGYGRLMDIRKKILSGFWADILVVNHRIEYITTPLGIIERKVEQRFVRHLDTGEWFSVRL